MGLSMKKTNTKALEKKYRDTRQTVHTRSVVTVTEREQRNITSGSEGVVGVQPDSIL